MYVEIIIAYAGLFLGNLARQLIPFFRKIYLGEIPEWDSIYTRRFIFYITFSAMEAYGRWGELILGADALPEILAVNFMLGLTTNWILEELAKWDWQEAVYRVQKRFRYAESG